MVRRVAPAYANLNMPGIVSYSPSDEKVRTWHTVAKGKKESLGSIAERYGVPVAMLINFNFPGSVKNGRIDPDIVNWYLYNHERFRCRTTTRDGMNYVFSGGERVAIPHLGTVEIGEPEIIRSRNTRFKLMMHANLNVSLGVAGDYSIFQIWDEKASLCCWYNYWAGGASGGLIPGAWLSMTRRGPWSDFTVTKAIGVDQFAGPGRFTTGGGGPVSKNYINFMALPNGAKTVPNPLAIQTGTTYGAGAGTSVGKLVLLKLGTKDGLLPFKGF